MWNVLTSLNKSGCFCESDNEELIEFSTKSRYTVSFSNFGASNVQIKACTCGLRLS